MKLTQHPEYQHVYVSNRDAALRCQEAVTRWRANNDIIAVPNYSLQWTYESAQSFVHSLSQLFQAYNQVLWNRFHYCRQCGGQCCVVDASSVQPFDLIAIALLNLATSVLPDNITARERECIYLSNHKCSWPEEWRTIKCWSFYCLGVGPRKPDDSIGKLYTAITTELQQVVRDYLPDELRKYEAISGVILADYLDDPVRFSEVLHNTLFEIFVGPLNEMYAVVDREMPRGHRNFTSMPDNTTSAILSLNDDVLASIAEIAEQVGDYPLTLLAMSGVPPEQVLADLESLQWIIEGHPSHRQQQLQDMYALYASISISDESKAAIILLKMRGLLLKILQSVVA